MRWKSHMTVAVIVAMPLLAVPETRPVAQPLGPNGGLVIAQGSDTTIVQPPADTRLRIRPLPNQSTVGPPQANPPLRATPVRPALLPPGAFPLICRGGVQGIAFSQAHLQDSRIRFDFQKGPQPAGQGLAEGQCSWTDRGMRPDEFAAVCHAVSQINIVASKSEALRQVGSPPTWNLQQITSPQAPYLGALRDPSRTTTLFVVREDTRNCFRVVGLPEPAPNSLRLPHAPTVAVLSREQALAAIERMRTASRDLRALVGIRPPGQQTGPQQIYSPQAVAAINQVANELDLMVLDWQRRLDTRGDEAQLANIDLQNMLQRQQQTLQTISNVSKALHDSAMAIIRKIGG